MKSEYLEALLSGELSGDETSRVEAALRRDDALREAYFDQAEMDHALRALLGGERGACGSEQFKKSVLARLRSEAAGEEHGFSRGVLTAILEERKSTPPLRWPDLLKAGVVAAAASVALTFSLQRIVFDGETGTSGERTSPGAGYLARVEASRDLVWATSSRPQHEDGWLQAGLRRIDSGFVRLAFNSGATALIEGPAAFSLESHNRLFLEEGRLTADVPPAASGFAVNTPRMNVVDIGTRFGVVVDGEGNSDLHVMEGTVEASRSSGNAVSLVVREGLAVRADDRTRTDLSPIEYAGDRFTLRIGDRARVTPRLHYTFDESSGNAILDSSGRTPLDTFLVAEGGLESSPLRAAGRTGGGLVFESGDSLETALDSSFRLAEPHTLSFWVKIAPRLGRRDTMTLARFGREGAGWEVACHFDPVTGSSGALRVSFGDGFVLGGTGLADGQWHHVAYRYLGGEGDLLGSRIHLFIDGQWEPATRWGAGTVRDGRAAVLSLGASGGGGIAGWVDEVRLYETAAPTRSVQSSAEP